MEKPPLKDIWMVTVCDIRVHDTRRIEHVYKVKQRKSWVVLSFLSRLILPPDLSWLSG